MPRTVSLPQDSAVDEHGWLAFLLDRSTKTENKPCEMLVTITNSGVKDFAVGFPKGSKLRWVFSITTLKPSAKFA